MIVKQHLFNNLNWPEEISKMDGDMSIFLLFMSPGFKEKETFLESLREHYPLVSMIGCSTAGEIMDTNVYDDSVVITSIKLEKTNCRKESVTISSMEESFQAGRDLSTRLAAADLKHMIVLSDGLHVNGAELVEGLKSVLPDISITGGLAGDSSDFEKPQR